MLHKAHKIQKAVIERSSFQSPTNMLISRCILSPHPQGTLPGILISLYHLDNSELTLKSLHCKTGCVLILVDLPHLSVMSTKYL